MLVKRTLKIETSFYSLNFGATFLIVFIKDGQERCSDKINTNKKESKYKYKRKKL